MSLARARAPPVTRFSRNAGAEGADELSRSSFMGLNRQCHNRQERQWETINAVLRKLRKHPVRAFDIGVCSPVDRFSRSGLVLFPIRDTVSNARLLNVFRRI